MRTKSIIVVGLLMAITSLLSGCAGSSKYMKETSTSTIDYKPGSNEAQVIFMRSSTLYLALNPTVFEINKEGEKLIGIVPARKKVAYRTSPGEHIFMVVGRRAEFMRANLAGGKTYYALLPPRVGVWGGGFFLKPVSKNELNSDDVTDCLKECEVVENTEYSFWWAKDNAPSIRSKREEYLKEWNEKAEEDKPALNADDGV